MSAWLVILAGIATAANIIIILWKMQHDKNASAALDASILAFTFWMFSDSFSALATGVIASMLFSIYLAVNPAAADKIFDEF